jgi:serine/threonine protein kinase
LLAAQESVIHRDLKPDNMLLTRDWTLQLTDFGEARAQNMGGTMTSVGTPIYIAPEVMRADHYDEKADTWSYGLCLVAMIRAERTLEQFFYQVSLPARRFTNDDLHDINAGFEEAQETKDHQGARHGADD